MEKIDDTPHNKQRTIQQNKALHKFYSLLSDELNTKGLDVRKVVKEGYSIWWTPHMVKEIIWRPFQKVKYGTDSTTFLTKHEQIDAIHEDIMRNLGEKFGVDYIDFPIDEQRQWEKVNHSEYKEKNVN